MGWKLIATILLGDVTKVPGDVDVEVELDLLHYLSILKMLLGDVTRVSSAEVDVQVVVGLDCLVSRF